MPFAMCPTCGQITHLSVGDVKVWYEEYHSKLPFGSLVTGQCYFCFQELNEVDVVVIRNVLGEKPVSRGDMGKIARIVTGKDGNLYSVKMDTGKEYYFVRAEIRKMRNADVQPAARVKKEEEEQ